MWSFEVDAVPVQDRRADDTEQLPSVIGRPRVLVVQLARIDDKRVLWSEHAEVCVIAYRDPSLVLQADEASRPRGHPATDLGQ